MEVEHLAGSVSRACNSLEFEVVSSSPTLGAEITLKEFFFFFKRGIWLVQSVEHATLNLGVVRLSPTLSIEST